MSATILSTRNRLEPQQLALYIACGSILMMFAALTSAYIVRQGAGNWLEFRLPDLFYVSTALLVVSSVTLQLSYVFFKRWSGNLYRGLLLVSIALGVGFVILQYEAWMAMFNSGLPLKGNPAPAFIYVLSGLHAAHVLGGLVALTLASVFAFRLPVVPTLRRQLRFKLTLTYWHFMGFLWIYLLLFFVLQR